MFKKLFKAYMEIAESMFCDSCVHL